ncbi:hypothetical protein BJ138DRAFT_231844 [Hygrophoropsis aurantiaca]|uniref:Uncharacterized protein n=1 Tax=Hygrophoropsis aurantiaca TaxID=72124 RepID=A0ACB8A9P0_9AGAM|nr:hypothetical protein BJ138DRAFT_231844 [Hygrophoropsis aurantiaca]
MPTDCANGIHTTAGHDTSRLRSGAQDNKHKYIFALDVPESIYIESDEEEEGCDDDCTDTESQWEYTPASPAQMAPGRPEAISNTYEKDSEPSAAQAIVACYRAAQMEKRDASEHKRRDKALPDIPDDVQSLYTLSRASMDTQSLVDLKWLPQPKVRLHSTDAPDLIEAQAEALRVMSRAGLTPSDKIKCQRAGCGDVLPNVKLLKYHIHIHIIGDITDASSTRSSFTSTTVAGSDDGTTKRAHSRSKSSVNTSAKEHHTLSKSVAVISTHSQSAIHVQKLLSPGGCTKNRRRARCPSSPNHPDRARALSPSRGSPTPSRGSSENSYGYNASIAAVLSPPTSPAPSVRGRPVLVSQQNLPILPMPLFSGTKGPGHAKSPMRALSPARALSPIRDGLRRVLSIGCLNNA